MFEPGHKLSPVKGRPPGSMNKRSIAFLEVLEKNNFCAAQALIDCYQEAKKTYDNYADIYDAIIKARELKNQVDGSCSAPIEDIAHKYLKIAADTAKDLASYAFPKLKAIEATHSKATDNMTPQQKLEALKMMVKVVEQELKNDGTPEPGPV